MTVWLLQSRPAGRRFSSRPPPVPRRCYNEWLFPPDGSNAFLEIFRHCCRTAIVACPEMRSEPVTWSKSDRAIYYRQDAARLRDMAEIETRSSIRDQLVRLSQEYCRIADGISRPLGEV